MHDAVQAYVQKNAKERSVCPLTADSPISEGSVGACARPTRGSLAALGLAAVVLAGTLLLAVRPGAHGPACLIRLVSGVPCPGCGMTRSLTNIWRGDLLRSFRYHPLGILLFAVCVGCVTLGCLDILAPRFRTVTARIRSAFMQARILIGFATLMILVWVARLAMAVLGMHYFSW